VVRVVVERWRHIVAAEAWAEAGWRRHAALPDNHRLYTHAFNIYVYSYLVTAGSFRIW